MRNRKSFARWILAGFGTAVLLAGAAISERHMALYGQGTPGQNAPGQSTPGQGAPNKGAPAWPKETSGPGGFGLSLGLGGLSISPDGKTVAGGQSDSRVGIWDATSGKLLSTLQGHSSTVTSVAYSPDAKTLYSGSLDGSIIAWDLTKGGMPRQLEGKASIVGLAVSADGKFLFVRTDAQKLQRYDLSSGLLKGEVPLAAAAH